MHQMNLEAKKSNGIQTNPYDRPFIVIDTVVFRLPAEAKYVMQDSRGSWFWSPRRPRIKEGDWTPNKTPLQRELSNGKFEARVYQTEINRPWQETMQRAIRIDRKKSE